MDTNICIHTYGLFWHSIVGLFWHSIVGLFWHSIVYCLPPAGGRIRSQGNKMRRPRRRIRSQDNKCAAYGDAIMNGRRKGIRWLSRFKLIRYGRISLATLPRYGRMGGRMGGRRRGCGFSSLMKQRIKGKNCAVFCFAGKRFLYIYLWCEYLGKRKKIFRL